MTSPQSALAISNSEMQTFKRCPRQWYVKYYLGYVPSDEKAASNRNLGTRIHIAMEAQHGYQMDPLTVLTILYAIEIGEHPEEEAELRAEQEMAEIMVSGYLDWAAETGDEADWGVVAVEADLKIPVPALPGVEFRLRIDQLAMRLSDGLLAFRDWKTSANFDRHEVLDLDPQMRFYCMAQQLATAGLEKAPKVAGGRLTTMRRVKRTGASKPPYYRTDDFRFNPDQLEATYRRAVRICSDIREARNMLDDVGGRDLALLNQVQRSELAPTPILTDCSWSCPFSTGLCTAMDDGSDWGGILASSGRYHKDDPYAYYERNTLATIRSMVSGDGG